MGFNEIDDLMQEAPGGQSHGRQAGREIADEGWTRRQRSRPLDELALQVEQADGFSIVTRPSDAGMVAHRGPVSDDEYVDTDVLREAAEEAFGFSYADVSAVYKQGPKTPDQLQLRAKIDARMLELSRDQGNMSQLASILELSEKTVDRALRRARDAWVEPIVKNPARKTTLVCFIEGTPDARPRRRSHRGCPAAMLPLPQYRDGTINLSDRAYARGL